MCGQSVHARLTRLGLVKPPVRFSDAEDARLRSEYAAHANAGTLAVLAGSFGRDKALICRRARILGLTDRNRKKPYLSESISKRSREWHLRNPHPRGATGLRHTEEAKAATKAGWNAWWDGLNDEQRSDHTLRQMKAKAAKRGSLATRRPHSTWKAGWREIGGIRAYYRSRWEANYARYLEWSRERGEISGWQHEPEIFWFAEINCGVRSYLPDFRVWENDGSSRLHEVKGWMDDRSRTCLGLMARHYPHEPIILVGSRQYRRIERDVSFLIAGWERAERGRAA